MSLTDTIASMRAVTAGIDWAEANHAVCVIDDDGEVVELVTVTHSRAGIAHLDRHPNYILAAFMASGNGLRHIAAAHDCAEIQARHDGTLQSANRAFRGLLSKTQPPPLDRSDAVEAEQVYIRAGDPLKQVGGRHRPDPGSLGDHSSAAHQPVRDGQQVLECAFPEELRQVRRHHAEDNPGRMACWKVGDGINRLGDERPRQQPAHLYDDVRNLLFVDELADRCSTFADCRLRQ